MRGRRGRIRSSSVVQHRARELRRTMTESERLLWSHLRNRQLGGLKFRRQHPIGPFIVDFYCAAKRLVVEVDGRIHEGQGDRDAVRTENLEEHGYRVIRFRNERVLADVESVLTDIEATCMSDECAVE